MGGASRRKSLLIAGWIGLALIATLDAQAPAIGEAVKPFVSVDAPVVALTNARVIDGTGAPARDGQTIILRDGRIAAIGDASRTAAPDGAHVIDLSGKSVIPGLVMLHEHLYYPVGPGVYGQLGQSFARLYLAGGVTTMRTGGNMNGFMDLNLKRGVDEGRVAGPAMDATAPYVNGPNAFLQMRSMADADEARKQVAYWADMGATSFKAYMQHLAGAACGRRRRGARAQDEGDRASLLGDLRRGCGDRHRQPGARLFCGHRFRARQAAGHLSGAGARPADRRGTRRGRSRISVTGEKARRPQGCAHLHADDLRDFHARPAAAAGLGVLLPLLKEQFEQNYRRTAENKESVYRTLFPKAMALERAFVKAGGLLVAGTDPTGGGGVIPGYSNQRAVELLADAGFSPLEAISIATRNGARYLGREDTIGTIAVGKQADLVVLDGDPSRTIADIRKVDTVFRLGVGYDPKALITSVTGRVGLW